MRSHAGLLCLTIRDGISTPLVLIGTRNPRYQLSYRATDLPLHLVWYAGGAGLALPGQNILIESTGAEKAYTAYSHYY